MYRIEPGRSADADALVAVETAASDRFAGTPFEAGTRADATPARELRAAAEAGRLWVARSAAGELVGFALVELLDGGPHLAELDVLPAHGRRGVGRALVERVQTWARSAGHASLTLTTFREVPWNAPFYARLGFRVLEAATLPPGLAALVRHEALRGLDPALRVVMRWAPGGGAGERA